MSDDLVLLDDRGSYAVITLNRPDKRNAMSTAAQARLQQVLRECVGRYPAIVLTGAGSAFCSGIDLKERRDRLERGEAPEPEYSRQGHSWIETIEAIRKHPAVFIAAVNGYALGGGVSLINVCDLAIAAEEAEIGMPEITFASYPTVAGPTTQLRILRKHASWMILTGQRIDGATAARWGLVNRAVPRAQLMQEAEALAERIAAYNPVTLDWSKKALDDIPSQVSDWTAALEYGRTVTSVIQNQIGKDKVTPAKF
jgi:enoyl-CoA hydratase/carnithine racemase